MMHFLASAEPNPEALKDWLSVLAYLLGIVLLVKKLFFEKIPQPMVTQEA